jgi:hypothetical protein
LPDTPSFRWKEALGRAGVTWFIGATDWSFNEHTVVKKVHVRELANEKTPPKRGQVVHMSAYEA